MIREMRLAALLTALTALALVAVVQFQHAHPDGFRLTLLESLGMNEKQVGLQWGGSFEDSLVDIADIAVLSSFAQTHGSPIASVVARITASL